MMLHFLFGLLAFATLAASQCTQNLTGFTGLDSTGRANRTLASGRTYLVYVPTTVSVNVSTPLSLSFHGAGDTSTLQEQLSQLSSPGLLINGLPFIAAYPQGAANTTANRTAAWLSAPYANASVDDIAFVKDVISDVSSHYCIDATRVYASGKSNGGGFVNLLACRNDTASLFAAFAPVSPALYPESLAFSGCAPGRPVPLLGSNGIEDMTIPFLGRNDSVTHLYGVGTSTINIPQWRGEWALRNGCNTTIPNNITDPYTNDTLTTWACTAIEQAFTTTNLGHSWPTTQGLDPSGAPNNTAAFNFTSPALIDFFSAHTLPQQFVSTNGNGTGASIW